MSLNKGTNSYATVLEADGYLSDRLDVAAWVDATPELKAQALVTATKYLDSLIWIGQVFDVNQSLAFPRVASYYDPFFGGTVYIENDVPSRITEATIELAYHLLNNDGLLDDTGSAESINIAGISITKPRSPNLLPSVVKSKINPLLKRGSSSSRSWWRAN